MFFTGAVQQVASGSRLAVHRVGVTASDRLAVPANPGIADVPGGGSLSQGTNYKAAVAGKNATGVTTASGVVNTTTSSDGLSTHAIRLTLTQLSGATGYSIFMSSAAAPLWVADITEVQRASGCTVTGVGIVSATSPGAGLVDVQVEGTQAPSNGAPFGTNSAWNFSGITPVDARLCRQCNPIVRLRPTDQRSQAAVVVELFGATQEDPTTYYYTGQQNTVTFGGGGASLGTGLLNQAVYPNGSSGFQSWETRGFAYLIVGLTNFSGQGTTVDVDLLLS